MPGRNGGRAADELGEGAENGLLEKRFHGKDSFHDEKLDPAAGSREKIQGRK